MQSVMTGQAAVGVVVSGVQVLSAAASTRRTASARAIPASEPEEQSAFIFFGLSTIFLVVTIGVHAWLVSLPAYKAVVRQTIFTVDNANPNDHEEGDEAGSLLESESPARKSGAKDFMWRLAKTNAEFNFAVAYVFIVTLVCLSLTFAPDRD